MGIKRSERFVPIPNEHGTQVYDRLRKRSWLFTTAHAVTLNYGPPIPQPPPTLPPELGGWSIPDWELVVRNFSTDAKRYLRARSTMRDTIDLGFDPCRRHLVTIGDVDSLAHKLFAGELRVTLSYRTAIISFPALRGRTARISEHASQFPVLGVLIIEATAPQPRAYQMTCGRPAFISMGSLLLYCDHHEGVDMP